MTNENNQQDKTLTRVEAAQYMTEVLGYKIQPATLEKFASQGGGPTFRKQWHGRRVVYELPDLKSWVQSSTSQKYTSTSHEREIRRQIERGYL